MRQSKTYKELLARLSRDLSVLSDKPEETPESTLCALWHAAAGTPKSAQMASEGELPVLEPENAANLIGLLERRLAGVPLAHLTGRQSFMGLEFLAGPEALVPRKETELLGYAVLNVLSEIVNERSHTTLIDVCTGSGNLALSLALHEKRARVYAADLSADAVGLARRNAKHLGLGDEMEFRIGDLLSPFDELHFYGAVDCITCNPPYISSGRVGTMPSEISGHEPRLAFDGGPFGIRILQRLATEAPRYLRQGGWLAFEVGAGQGPSIVRRIRSSGMYSKIRTVEDGSGEVRVVLARMGGA
jgi:release factor glutamine methyltransferase